MAGGRLPGLDASPGMIAAGARTGTEVVVGGRGHGVVTGLLLGSIDAERTACLGASFGGYMANWIPATPTGSRRSSATLVSRHDGDPDSVPHRFLEFPGENHWVLSPGNARIWNETVLAFLEWHVLGGKWSPPRLA